MHFCVKYLYKLIHLQQTTVEKSKSQGWYGGSYSWVAQQYPVALPRDWIENGADKVAKTLQRACSVLLALRCFVNRLVGKNFVMSYTLADLIVGGLNICIGCHKFCSSYNVIICNFMRFGNLAGLSRLGALFVLRICRLKKFCYTVKFAKCQRDDLC